MSLKLYLHPLSSFCHKVLIALYENGTAFEPAMVNFGDDEGSAALKRLWPMGKIPVLVDGDRAVPETSIIIEYLQAHHPGPVRLLPDDAEARLEARLWDRFFDLYVHMPMQAIVGDRIRPEASRDPHGVAQARATLAKAYAVADRQLAGKTWATGADFTIADCAASPALFYASIVAPIDAAHGNLRDYFERLMARPSIRRVIAEARPFFEYFPYREAMPARFLGD